MKMKRILKKVITHVLTIAMLVSVFSTVDMGWNVREVQAATNTVVFAHDTINVPTANDYYTVTNSDVQVYGNMAVNWGFRFARNDLITVKTSDNYHITTVEIYTANNTPTNENAKGPYSVTRGNLVYSEEQPRYYNKLYF